MENASKALLIAGGILISMLVLSMGVLLFTTFRDAGSQYDRNLEATEIQKFNVNFTKFEGRTDIKIHEIVSLMQFSWESSKNTGDYVNIRIRGGALIGMAGVRRIDQVIKNVENYSDREYTVGLIEYNSETGKVKRMEFIEVK